MSNPLYPSYSLAKLYDTIVRVVAGDPLVSTASFNAAYDRVEAETSGLYANGVLTGGELVGLFGALPASALTAMKARAANDLWGGLQRIRSEREFKRPIVVAEDIIGLMPVTVTIDKISEEAFYRTLNLPVISYSYHWDQTKAITEVSYSHSWETRKDIARVSHSTAYDETKRLPSYSEHHSYDMTRGVKTTSYSRSYSKDTHWSNSQNRSDSVSVSKFAEG